LSEPLSLSHKPPGPIGLFTAVDRLYTRERIHNSPNIFGMIQVCSKTLKLGHSNPCTIC